MPAPRPFRFGIQASGAASAADWVELARRAEGNGFSCLTMPDHFTDQLAPVPALTAAAATTTALRVGALVWDNDYKHPVVLAKELATIDLLSEGRLEIGLGAGWMISDYEQAGMSYDPAPVRIDRFEEGLAIIRKAMTGETFSAAGTHYRVDGYAGRPLPVQRPCPPILIGGGGKRMLRLAGREADIVGINGTMNEGRVGAGTLSTMTAEAVDEKVGFVRAAAGERMGAIEMNIRVFMSRVTDHRDKVLADLSAGLAQPVELLVHSPFALIGSTAKIVEDLLARRERWGFSYVIVGPEEVDSFAPVVARLAGT